MKEGEADDKASSQSHRSILSGTAVLFVGTAIGLALGFLARMVPARLLGPDQYGLLMLGWTVVSVIGFVAKLGFKDGVTRHVPRADTTAERKSVFVTAVTITFPWSLALAGGVFLFSNHLAMHVFDDSQLAAIIRIFAVTLPITTLSMVVLGTFRGYERAKEYVIVKKILNPGLRTIFIAGAILAGYSTFGAAIGWLLASVCSLAIAVWFLYRVTTIFEAETAPLRHRELFLFSAPLMISGVMGLAINYGDNFLIGYFLSSSAVGMYDPAYMIGGLVTTGLTVFAYMFLPVFSKLHSNQQFNEMESFYRVVTKWVISVTLPVYLLIGLFPESLLSITFGDAYTDGAIALAVLATGAFVNAGVGLCVQALVSIGDTRFIMVVNVGAAILNLVLNAMLIPEFGIIGAAFASAITTASYNLVYTYRLYRTTGIVAFPRTILGPVLVTGGVAIGLSRVIQDGSGIPVLIGMLLLFTVVYLLLYIRLGAIGEEDLELIDIAEERTNIDLSAVKRIVQSTMPEQ
ncbi:flippase [Halobacterium salinarum]|uniref:flippase n=1 Tax=Halobacterium salinarum TaxID=2242 RepID=UPI0025576ABD|nr:flippase [Halobacterium salinarum]MDL0125117.1 flippase [Halobacterium salinarum]